MDARGIINWESRWSNRLRLSAAGFLSRHRSLSLPIEAYAAFQRHEAQMLAAALSYYTILSLFPLLLILVSLFSPFLAEDQVVAEITRFTRTIFPASGAEVRNVLREIINARGAIEIVAAFGYIWSVSGVFDVIQRGMNRAWEVATPRPVWASRLVSLAMVLTIVVVFAVNVLLTVTLRTGQAIRPVGGAGRATDVGALALSTLYSVAAFALVYMLCTYPRLGWRKIWLGAIVGGVLWEASKQLFTWYVLNLAHFNLVYGSIGTVIILLVWAHMTAMILLYGAELDAARHRRALPSAV